MLCRIQGHNGFSRGRYGYYLESLGFAVTVTPAIALLAVHHGKSQSTIIFLSLQSLLQDPHQIIFG